jgi:hypothetical protein
VLDWPRFRCLEAENCPPPAILAAAFAAASVTAMAQDKKPSADDCKKDPKMKGCEQMKK